MRTIIALPINSCCGSFLPVHHPIVLKMEEGLEENVGGSDDMRLGSLRPCNGREADTFRLTSAEAQLQAEILHCLQP